MVNGFDSFLAQAATALAADGVKRETLLRLFVNHALEVLNRAPGVTPRDWKKHAEQVAICLVPSQ